MFLALKCNPHFSELSLSEMQFPDSCFMRPTPFQHVVLLSALSHHILFHDTLETLQERLGYHFTDTRLLHRAVTHSSSTTTSFFVAPNHLRNALSNCGLRSIEYLSSSSSGGGKGTGGMKDLIKSARMGFEEADESLRLQNNEQLEFLGDAVLEYICR